MLKEQDLQKSSMNDGLKSLEAHLKQLRDELDQKQTSHKNAMIDRQELLSQDLNKIKAPHGRGDVSPRRKEDLSNSRQTLETLY